MVEITKKEGHLLLSIAVAPEAPMEFHKKMAGVDKLGNTKYKLREYSLILKNPVSGVAKRSEEYFEYDPEPKEEFVEIDELKEEVVEKLQEIGTAESIQELADEMDDGYQKVKRRVDQLEEDGVIEKSYGGIGNGNKKNIELAGEIEPDYNTWMITGKAVAVLKDFIEDQPPILQNHLAKLYEQRIVYAPKHCQEKIEA